MFDEEKIKGPVFPIITPFTVHGDIDHEALTSYVDFLYRNGARVFYITAHSSRIGLLTIDELEYLNRTVIKYVKVNYPDVFVIAAAPIYGGIDSILDIMDSATYYKADLISVMFTERYYSDEQVIEFYEELAEGSEIPILVHEEPLNAKKGSQKVQWPISLLEKVLSIDNIIALKEDSHDNGYTRKIIDKFKDSTSIILAGGGKEQFLDFRYFGKCAYLVGVGSFVPKIALDFYNAYLTNKNEKIWDIIRDIERPFFKVAFELGWHIALKSAMEYMGIMKRHERMPLKPLNETEHHKIGEVLKEMGLLK